MSRTLLLITGILLVAVAAGFAGAPAVESSGGRDGLPDVTRAAAEIDRLVEADLARHELEPNPVADDATFLRRVYLDVIGRIPDARETREFLKSSDRRKRAQLIDRLLSSPGHMSHQYNYFADLFRAKTRVGGRVSGEPFIHWIKNSVHENKPYDAMVREMLTATGPAHRRGNGATGYFLRDRGMPLDNMANTMRIFAGTRLECAQCHDHPTEKWTQKQFFEMAAFTGGLRYNNSELVNQTGRDLRRLGQKVRREQGDKVFRAFRQRLQGLQAGLGGSGTGVVRLPDDYQYDDAQPGSIVTAKTAFGEEVVVQTKVQEDRRRRPRGKNKGKGRRNQRRARVQEVDSRETFAQWLTSPDNPRFTQVAANRMWQRLMGRGVIDPIDDLKDDTVADNPELMAYLTQLMKDVGYDLRAFQRVILNSKTYQREAWAEDVPAGKPFHFPGPVLRRMSAEQMWDSLVTLVVPDLDADLPLESPRARAIYDRFAAVDGKSAEEIVEALQPSVGDDGNPMSMRDQARQRAQAQRRKIQPLLRRYQRAERRGDTKTMTEVRAEMEALGMDPDRFLKARRYGRNLVRASEVGAPAPPGHFLRDFGQSDREQLDGAHRDASVPQVLNLLNGFVDEELLAKKQGLLLSSVRQGKTPDARIRTAFVSILNRPPTRGELRIWKSDVAADGDVVYSDLIWTLINSHEFRFIR